MHVLIFILCHFVVQSDFTFPDGMEDSSDVYDPIGYSKLHLVTRPKTFVPDFVTTLLDWHHDPDVAYMLNGNYL